VEFSPEDHENFMDKLDRLRDRSLMLASEYEGPIPLEVVRNTHERIISRAETLRRKAELDIAIPPEFDIPYAQTSVLPSLQPSFEKHDAPLPDDLDETDLDLDALPEFDDLQDNDAGEAKEASPEIKIEALPPLQESETAVPQAEQTEKALKEKPEPKQNKAKTAKEKKAASSKKLKESKESIAEIDVVEELDSVLDVRVKQPIAIKLVAIVSTLLFVSLAAITFLVSMLVSADVQLTAEDNNYSINRRIAQAIGTNLESAQAAVISLLFDMSTLSDSIPDQEKKNAIVEFFFAHNNEIAAINANADQFLINSNFFETNALDTSLPEVWKTAEAETIRQAASGLVMVRNASPVFGVPMLVIIIPTNNSTALVYFSTQNLKTLFNTGDNVSFLIDENGNILIHADESMTIGGANVKDLPYVQNILKTTGTNTQQIYKDNDGNEYFGVFQRLQGLETTTLITIIKADIVFGGIAETTKRNIIISFAVLVFSIIFIILFSRNISKPLKELIHAVERMESGNYNINLTHKSRDEIGVLTESFLSMRNGLENFEKFTNKSIVELAKQGKLSRTGENKKVTICFALIRDFSEMSEGFVAATLVDFVNEYLDLMVPCVTENGGNVDKFLTQDGVVIMALWGSPESSGNPERDALNCLRAALSMRAALRCLNEHRSRRNGIHIPLIKIGCGINSGSVVAGQMGSDERMEYTVIGDAVNLAARIEGPNDLFDTDILISEETYNLVGRYLTIEEQESIEVKGKEKPLRVFSVVNMNDEKESASILADLNRLPGALPELCAKCVGKDGPATMEEVRARWKINASTGADR
jgi:adenylate cyclase